MEESDHRVQMRWNYRLRQLLRLTVLLLSRKGCWSHGAKNHGSEVQVPSLTFPGTRKKSVKFVEHYFLETLTQYTNSTCMATLRFFLLVNNRSWLKPVTPFLLCPISRAHCQKENSLTSNRSWIYSDKKRNLRPTRHRVSLWCVLRRNSCLSLSTFLLS